MILFLEYTYNLYFIFKVFMNIALNDLLKNYISKFHTKI